jgi:hypothetical protein
LLVKVMMVEVVRDNSAAQVVVAQEGLEDRQVALMSVVLVVWVSSIIMLRVLMRTMPEVEVGTEMPEQVVVESVGAAMPEQWVVTELTVQAAEVAAEDTLGQVEVLVMGDRVS